MNGLKHTNDHPQALAQSQAAPAPERAVVQTAASGSRDRSVALKAKEPAVDLVQEFSADRVINLPAFGIIINFADGAGTISSDLHEEGEGAKDYNLAMDGIESMILAHAMAGVDVESPAYLEGIETAVEACANNIPDSDVATLSVQRDEPLEALKTLKAKHQAMLDRLDEKGVSADYGDLEELERWVIEAFAAINKPVAAAGAKA